jgi:hypothetical protein
MLEREIMRVVYHKELGPIPVQVSHDGAACGYANVRSPGKPNAVYSCLV